MPDPLPAAAPAPPPKPITVRAEWTMVLVCAALVTLFSIIGVLTESRSGRRGDVDFFSGLAGLIWWFGHALWLSMDRRRRGLEVGAWRFGVVFFGFLAVWLYLLLEYRMKGFLLILLALGIYLAIALVLVVVVALAVGF